MFRASRYVLTAISRLPVDVGEEPLVRRLRRGFGERDRLVDAVVDVFLDRPHVGFREHAGVDDLVAEHDDRIPELLALYLFLGAIDGARRIAHGVPAEP